MRGALPRPTACQNAAWSFCHSYEAIVGPRHALRTLASFVPSPARLQRFSFGRTAATSTRLRFNFVVGRVSGCADSSRSLRTNPSLARDNAVVFTNPLGRFVAPTRGIVLGPFSPIVLHAINRLG